MQLQRGEAGLSDDVVLEIEDALEILQRHVDEKADAARQRLQEPDVGDRRGELDMAHALAPDLGQGHLDAALLADDAAILHALVLAAQALVILDRPEDAGAEQPVPLRLEGAVVDGLGLLDFAERPGPDPLRAGDRDLDLVEALGGGHLAEEVHQLVHVLLLPASRAGSRVRQLIAKAGPRRSSRRARSRHQKFFCSSSTLRQSERSSFTSTLKDSGMPASKLS